MALHYKNTLNLPKEIIQVCFCREHGTDDLHTLLGAPPPRRWGRMDPASRMAVACVAMTRGKFGIPEPERSCGFVLGSRYGSFSTDLSYWATIESGQPSPLLFSYTLPNIAATEAASFFGLTGPVYAVIDRASPLDAARNEAKRLIGNISGLHHMLFAAVDVLPCAHPYATIGVVGVGDEGV